MTTYPLSWPASLSPSSESWTIENADRSGGVSITGAEQIVGSGGGRWRAKMTFQLFREETPVMRAFLAGLRGRAGTVLVGPADLYGMPQASDPGDDFLVDVGLLGREQNGSPPYRPAAPARLVAAAPLRATTISIAMPANRPLPLGCYVGIGDRLHVIVAAVEVGGAGRFDCEIEPPLRAAAPVDQPVVFAPTCLMRLATPVDGLSVQAATFMTDVTLDLVEAF